MPIVITKKDCTVTIYHSCIEIGNGENRQRYVGYSVKEAIRKFKEEFSDEKICNS